jgi:hypothetical protein
MRRRVKPDDNSLIPREVVVFDVVPAPKSAAVRPSVNRHASAYQPCDEWMAQRRVAERLSS